MSTMRSLGRQMGLGYMKDKQASIKGKGASKRATGAIEKGRVNPK